MSTPAELLPIREIVEPTDDGEAAEIIRSCAADATPVYPIGGGSSLDYGLPARREGIGLSLAKLNSVVDYPARDMTISVGAGLTMQALATVLDSEQQRLPIDVPQADRATIGGVVATNFNGCRRYGQGNVRDHVIGVHAIDGRGMPFRGGGRVVKNVAGYDFCKLLTGSLGTLGVITQLTFKLKPKPPASAVIVCQPVDLGGAEKLLAALVHSQTRPVAIELLGGPAWNQDPPWQELGFPQGDGLLLAVALEGTNAEVDWMVPELESEWRALGVSKSIGLRSGDTQPLMHSLAEFPARESPLVVKVNVVPSHTTRVVAAAREIDESCSFQAHAGSGVVIVRFSTFPEAGLSKTLVSQLQPVAAAGAGNVVILANPSGAEQTRQSVWGNSLAPYELMTKVKREFDPQNILNPGRFVYD